jgi:hypothetical protein
LSYDIQRELYRQLRADQQIVERAARRLRNRAIADGYTSVEYKHVTFALALLLDELARHLRDLNSELRKRVVEVCRGLLTDHRRDTRPGG